MVDMEHFGQELFYALASTEPQRNQLITPLPLATVLILLRANAEVDSAYEIGDYLGLIGKANEVIQENYDNLLRKMEKTKYFTMSNNISIVTSQIVVDTVKLSIRDTIKVWRTHRICYKAADLTNSGHKTDILLETKMHFNNVFRYSLSSSTRGYFHTHNGDKIEKEMLNHIAEVRYGKVPQLSATAIEVPYSDGNTFLLIFLPHNPMGIRELEKHLKVFPLGSMNSYLRRNRLKLILPKFKTHVKMSVRDGLIELGMGSMFKRLCETTSHIRVGDIVFSSSFGINEQTAGAETFIDDDEATLAKIPEIRVDHPFIFLVKSIRNDIYLMGKIVT
ncbi:serine protease inhibitor 42Dd-like [Lucilia cuprina]|uniref:serine protease inhibitor 42Dd-like n=1 Tax=Lucilia cuprina TaxID=7375 RepID=UPI001F0659C4|nr:serine protease inhibitor 42Dd-like [Lucilia cuprina]